MSLFVIVDLTAPRSVPLELQLTVPQVMVPVVPLIHEIEHPFDMFRNLEMKYDWVLKPLHYRTADDRLPQKSIIEPARERRMKSGSAELRVRDFEAHLNILVRAQNFENS